MFQHVSTCFNALIGIDRRWLNGGAKWRQNLQAPLPGCQLHQSCPAGLRSPDVSRVDIKK